MEYFSVDSLLAAVDSSQSPLSFEYQVFFMSQKKCWQSSFYDQSM